MGCEIMVEKEYISEIFRWYENGILTVNRTYQRKLVWSLEEKRYFINTIINDYPVPLFLMVNTIEIKNGVEYARKEIIDGLQRLEAIISFMKNEYDVKIDEKYQYFNRDVFPGDGILLRSGQLKQRKPVLSADISRRFMLYQLPITTINAESTIVDDVFKRINSTGKKLSSQDLREAGVNSNFSNLVRKTAYGLRGDGSEDIINLQDMQNFSLNNKGLHYGIDINTIFWIEQGIISEDSIRRSKDEEIIATLYNCILTNNKCGVTSESLNNLYNENSRVYQTNENILTEFKSKELINSFIYIINDFLEIFKAKNLSFEKLLFSKAKNYNKDLVFIIVFLSFYQLYCEHYIIKDYNKVGDLLNNIADRELNTIIDKSDCQWNMDIRNHLIERIKNCLIKAMVFKETIINPEWNKDFYDLLMRAVVEEQMYDFKIGMRDLRNGNYNEKLIPKCIQTLIAMANTNPNKEGWVILGISDKESDAIDFKKHYNVEYSQLNNYYITGIDNEAIRYHDSVQKYIEKIKSIIEQQDILDSVIHDILTTISVKQYCNRTLIVLRLKTDKPLFYKKELYVRYQSHLHPIELGSNEYYKLIEKFQKAP